VHCENIDNCKLPQNICVKHLSISFQEALLNIIDQKLSVSPRGFCAKFAETNFPSPEDANNNLLLFTCALVPKALASVMTSFVLAASIYEKVRDLLQIIRSKSETKRNGFPFLPDFKIRS
jgi:hypothetical protein